MYVPAERNFLSSVENINKVSNLIVGSLQHYLVEFRNAQLANKGKAIDLPINDSKVVYDPKDDENYLEFGGKRLKLSHASSGFHSVVPLFWVTQYLNHFVGQPEKKMLQLLSLDQTVRRNKELSELNVLGLNEKAIRAEEKKINDKYVCKHLINIVEEPEQNLFPTSQQQILHSLLAFNNLGDANRLIMTTHSPYLINFLNVAIQAADLKDQIVEKGKKELLPKLYGIVPENALVKADDVQIYQLDKRQGRITKLPTEYGIPSDDIYLNRQLKLGNDQFDALLDIEAEL